MIRGFARFTVAWTLAGLVTSTAASVATPDRVTAGTPRRLGFEERVAAQRAIERVYGEHRVWPATNPKPKPPLPEVFPEEKLRARVEDYLL